MRLGLYTFAALAFIGLVAGFVYTMAPGNYILDIAGYNLNLPVALWIVLPILLLLAFTVLHMLYHGTRNYFVHRKWQRDIDTMNDAMYWSMIGEPKEHNYSVPQVAEGASLLATSIIDPIGMPKGITSKLTNTVEWIQKIKSGEYVNLRKMKIERFMTKENNILKQNQLNRLNIEPQFADDILRSSEMYAPDVTKVAMQGYLKSQTLFKLMKYSDKFTFDDISVLLDRADAGEDIGFSLDTMESLIKEKELECSEYMRLVSSAIKAFDPDQNLAFFKKLAHEKRNAESAYLFLLFRYEMVEKAENFLEEQGENEFIAFRAFLALKKSKFNYKVRDFVVAANVCK